MRVSSLIATATPSAAWVSPALGAGRSARRPIAPGLGRAGFSSHSAAPSGEGTERSQSRSVFRWPVTMQERRGKKACSRQKMSDGHPSWSPAEPSARLRTAASSCSGKPGPVRRSSLEPASCRSERREAGRSSPLFASTTCRGLLSRAQTLASKP